MLMLLTVNTELLLLLDGAGGDCDQHLPWEETEEHCDQGMDHVHRDQPHVI